MNCLILHARDPTGNSGSGIGSGSGTTLITSGTDAGLGFGTITPDTKDEDEGVRDTTRAKDISGDSGSERIGVGIAIPSGKGTWLIGRIISTAILGLCLVYLGLYAGSFTGSNDLTTTGCLKAGSATNANVFLLYF